MDDLRRRTLRLWAALDAGYAALLAAIAGLAVPWKTPLANAAALAYAAAVAASVPGLVKQRRWAWRLAVGTSLVGLAGGAIVVAGLVASWAYLRAVYGAFGAGASVVALMLAAIAFQLLGLYPAIRLRALLRREVRLGAGRPAVGGALAIALLPLALGAGVHARYAITEVGRVPDRLLGDALALARATAEGTVTPTATPLAQVPAGAGPVYVTLWRDGQLRARGAGGGSDLASAIRSAATAMAATLPGGAPLMGALRIDRPTGSAPAPAWLAALAVGLSPGRDGLRARSGAVVLPDEPIRATRVGAAALLPSLQELRVRIDPAWLGARLPDREGLERFRAESWMETARGPARLERGRPVPAEPVDLRRAADAAARYLTRQVGADGRFVYRYDVAADVASTDDASYSLARHAATVWALAELAPPSPETERAVAWLVGRVRAPCRGAATACMLDGGDAKVGPTALAVVALLAHARATGDRRHEPLARALAEFLLTMQRPDGELDHVYAPEADRVDARARLMFASEEAAFALVVAHERFGDERLLRAAERALAYLTGPKYAFFLGRFVWGADAWTCVAADRAWPRLRNRGYLDFCVGYAGFLRRLQFTPDPGGPQSDYAGHYGFGGFLVPQAPAAAGFSEAVLATLALAQHHGAGADVIAPLRAQAARALTALATDQLGPDDPRARNPARAEGGIARSLAEPEIRIDFVQHAAFALARGAELGVR